MCRSRLRLSKVFTNDAAAKHTKQPCYQLKVSHRRTNIARIYCENMWGSRLKLSNVLTLYALELNTENNLPIASFL